MIVLTANICFDGLGGSVFEDQVDHFSVDKITLGAVLDPVLSVYHR